MNTYIFYTAFGQVRIDAANFIGAYDRFSELFPVMSGSVKGYRVMRHEMEEQCVG